VLKICDQSKHVVPLGVGTGIFLSSDRLPVAVVRNSLPTESSAEKIKTLTIGLPTRDNTLIIS